VSQEDFVRTRIIHLINPKTDSATTRPLYMNRALYSPLAGLLAVAASTPRDQYEVVLTDENIETIDFDLKADLVGISAMTSYVNRGYEIADQFRARGVPVVMGGVHPSFMSQEAGKHLRSLPPLPPFLPYWARFLNTVAARESTGSAHFLSWPRM
jgi:B12 binding domain